MIRRELPSQDLLITQQDHAVLAGQMLEYWGNGKFQRAEAARASWSSVVVGARWHDAGWPLHDRQPTLNDAGRPLDVFETPWPIALPVWTASADRATSADPYAGLLTSLHVMTLAAELARDSPSGSTAAADRAATFAINKFLHREIERQEELRASLQLAAVGPLTMGLAAAGVSHAEDLLRLHLRAVQVADALSLGLCCTHPPARRTRQVHASVGAGPIVLEQWRIDDGTLCVRPWPFNRPRLEFTVPVRRLAAKHWASASDYQAAFAAADAEPLRLTISAG